jgi:hypothetical protein
MIPEQPCSCCGSRRFGLVRGVWIDAFVDGNAVRCTARLQFDLAMCGGCGAAHLMPTSNADPYEHPLGKFEYELFDLPPSPPYR